jgi:hypothetical protein
MATGTHGNAAATHRCHHGVERPPAAEAAARARSGAFPLVPDVGKGVLNSPLRAAAARLREA